MAIKRRSVLAGGAGVLAAGWVSVPAILRAQSGGATITSHGFATHGDVSYPADAKNLEYVNPAAPKGGTIRLAGRGTFDSLNPFILKGTPAAAAGSIYESLMVGTADEAATSYGLIAESIEYPQDRSWAIFRLRPAARWQDVLKAERLDERVVKFTFRDGTNHELPLIIGQLTVLPKHWWATRDFEKTSLEVPLGSGAYKVESFEAGRYVMLKRVEDHWSRDLWLSRGRSNFD